MLFTASKTVKDWPEISFYEDGYSSSSQKTIWQVIRNACDVTNEFLAWPLNFSTAFSRTSRSRLRRRGELLYPGEVRSRFLIETHINGEKFCLQITCAGAARQTSVWVSMVKAVEKLRSHSETSIHKWRHRRFRSVLKSFLVGVKFQAAYLHDARTVFDAVRSIFPIKNVPTECASWISRKFVQIFKLKITFSPL